MNIRDFILENVFNIDEELSEFVKETLDIPEKNPCSTEETMGCTGTVCEDCPLSDSYCEKVLDAFKFIDSNLDDGFDDCPHVNEEERDRIRVWISNNPDIRF